MSSQAAVAAAVSPATGREREVQQSSGQRCPKTATQLLRKVRTFKEKKEKAAISSNRATGLAKAARSDWVKINHNDVLCLISALCISTRPKFNHLFFLSFSLSRKLKHCLSLSHPVVSVTRNTAIHHKHMPLHYHRLFHCWLIVKWFWYALRNDLALA